MNADSVETTHRGTLFNVQVLHARDQDGRTYTREIVRHPGAVLVLPVLNRGTKQQIVMIRNFRVAVDQRLWELPAGKLEPDESPETAAGRELIEETGYRAGRMSKLAEFYTSPGFADERMHAYVAEDLVEADRALQPGEDIEVAVLDVDEAVAMAMDGRICDGKTIVALLMWRLRSENTLVATGPTAESPAS